MFDVEEDGVGGVQGKDDSYVLSAYPAGTTGPIGVAATTVEASPPWNQGGERVFLDDDSERAIVRDSNGSNGIVQTTTVTVEYSSDESDKKAVKGN